MFRRLVWMFRVLLAIGLGCLVRLGRRILRLPPRIWHGMMPLHAITASVSADRIAGFPSQSVVMQPRQDPAYALTHASDFDVIVESQGYQWYDQHLACLCHLFLHGDVWNTSFQPFFPIQHQALNHFIFRLLRLCGIRIIVFPFGTDVAYRDRYRDRYDWVGCLQRDYSSWDLTAWGETTRKRVALFSRYADLVIGMDSSLVRFLTRNDLYFKSFPVDTDRLQPTFAKQQNRIPLIVHATNHRNVKGTDILIDVVELLNRSSIKCELQIIEKVDREMAFEIYRTADIIADQFVMGAFGVFGLEALALGKPVLTYLDSAHLADPVFNLPMVNTTHENMCEVIGVLVLVQKLRERLGRFSREQVEKYQSVEALSEVWKQIYDHVWRGKQLELEKTLHFSAERKARPFTEDPRRPEFWPAPVGDLMPEIEQALMRLPIAKQEF